MIVAGIFRTLGERLARPFVQAARAVGRAVADVGGALSRAGTIIEAAAIKRIETEEVQIDERSREVLDVGDDTIIDPAGIAEAVTKLRREYSYTVHLISLDPATGKRLDQFISLSTN